MNRRLENRDEDWRQGLRTRGDGNFGRCSPLIFLTCGGRIAVAVGHRGGSPFHPLLPLHSEVPPFILLRIVQTINFYFACTGFLLYCVTSQVCFISSGAVFNDGGPNYCCTELQWRVNSCFGYLLIDSKLVGSAVKFAPV